MAEKKTLDLLKDAFDLSKRRKFDVKDDNGKTVCSLYFKAITRADRARATQRAGSDDPCLLYTSPSPRDATLSRMPSSA